MNKQTLGKLIQTTLDLQDWRLNARAPGNIVLNRKLANGLDILYLQPYSGVYSLSFGASLIGVRAYDHVTNVLVQASPRLLKLDNYSYLVHSRQVTEMLFAEIIKPSDFDPWLPTARAMVHEDVLPQLERYRYLGPLHERIAASTPLEIQSFMPTTGIGGAAPHVAIIKHLVQADDADQFLLDFIRRFQEAGDAYEQRASLMRKLQEILLTTPPLSKQEIWGLPDE